VQDAAKVHDDELLTLIAECRRSPTAARKLLKSLPAQLRLELRPYTNGDELANRVTPELLRVTQHSLQHSAAVTKELLEFSLHDVYRMNTRFRCVGGHFAHYHPCLSATGCIPCAAGTFCTSTHVQST
jgi:hypothetical protein